MFIENFPKRLSPRQGQKQVARQLDSLVGEGVKVVLIEAPTGVGKTFISEMIAKTLGLTYCIVPTVMLQKQYCDEIEDAAPLLGRARFPCVSGNRAWGDSVRAKIREGVVSRHSGILNCSIAPCMSMKSEERREYLNQCERDSGPCPYNVSLDVAQSYPIVAANLYSYLFNVVFQDKMTPRKVMILDECHDTDMSIRDFLGVEITIPAKIDLTRFETLDQWIPFLENEDTIQLICGNRQKDRTKLQENIEKLKLLDKAAFKVLHERNATKFRCYPLDIRSFFKKAILDQCQYLFMMSGTVYNKEDFCRPLGLDPKTVGFIRIESDFPAKNRPVVMPRKPLNLSHSQWGSNKPQMLTEIKRIFRDHPDEKGLIHVPSYRMAEELYNDLRGRTITHQPSDKEVTLQNFYDDEKPTVLISPVINQGVDFKGDRARFSIIIRPHYMTPDDPYVKWALDNNLWSWYNYKALIVLGQQVGRIVRSNDDYGTVYLLDSRFGSLLSKNQRHLPKWFKEGLVHDA